MIKRLRTWAALLPLALTIAVAGSVLQGQGPSTPILLVTNSGGTNPFQGFLAEILKAEGIPSFTSQQVSALNASTLSGTRLVLLGETTLSPVQATLLRDYVNQGGRLIAMRPADQIADLFGLVPQGTSTLNGYMLINQADAAGAGLSTVTLPIRGTASHFSVTGAAATVATLYSDRSTPTTYPAVVRNNRTVAWAFDLARSVVYARQGDPANINVDTGLVPPLQSFDMFYTGFDAQRIAVPYADIQMRLLARQIADLLADDQPLPRLWYYPSARRAMMILGADAHHNPNNAFDQMMASAESFGGRVTFFVARYMPEPTPAQAANWRARGHEITTHPYGSNDGVSLQQGFQFATDWFASAGLGAPSRTVRSHQIEWLGWVDAAQIAANFGGGLDLNHYSFGPAVLQPNGRQGQGYITGSGRPMRFVNTNGTLVQPAIYGQPTVLIDHQLFGITIWSDTLSTADALGVSRTLIDAAVTDYHTVIPTQWHVDYYTWGEVQPWVDGTMEYAQANNVPMWTGERWLRYTEARDATLISGTTWSSTLRQLQFTVTVPTGAEAQTVMVPTLYAGNQLVDVRVNGTVTAVTTQLLNGRSESMFSVAPSSGGASVIVTYGTATPSLTINDVSVVEGTASQNTAVFTVTLSPASSSQVTVNFAAASGTATAPADFGAGSGTLTFAPTVTTRTISVPIVNDAVLEPDETFSVLLSAATNATIARATGVGTILNDDSALPSLTIDDVSVQEGNTGSTAAAVTLTLSAASAQTVTVSWATADGTATSPADYQARSGVATIPAGATTAQIPISVVGDTVIEPNEAFTVVLSTPTNAVLADNVAIVTITNDDTAGNNGTFVRTTRSDFACSVQTAVIVTQAADGEVQLAGTFGDEFAGGLGPQWTFDAWTGGSYTPTVSGGLLSIGNATGAYVRSISPLTVGTFETVAQFSAAPWEHIGWAGLDFADDRWAIFSTMGTTTTLFARTNAGGGEQTTSLGPIPSGYHDYRVERIPGTGSDQFQYSIDGVVVATHTVSGMPAALYLYQSHNGGATPTLNVDSIWVYPTYVPAGSLESCSVDAGSTVTWTTASWVGSTPAGATLGVRTRTSDDGSTWSAWSSPLTASGQPITSPAGRYLQYGLDLTSSTAALSPVVESVTFATGPAVTPTLSAVGASIAEGNNGTVNATFALTLSQASTQTVTVSFATAAGTATAGVDFTTTSGTLTLTAGITNQSVTVPVIGDLLDETDETFTLSLSAPVNATIGTGTATGTILDDDPTPTLSIGGASVTEGSVNMGFTVTLTPASGRTVTVNFATTSGTANAGSDFTTTSGMLTFGPGVTTQIANVPVLADAVDEVDETFTVTLSAAANATLGTETATGTILDDDPLPVLSVSSPSVTEGNVNLSFTITLTPVSSRAVTVSYATASGTATSGVDFTARSGSLTFNPGVSSQTVTVPVLSDTLDEVDETFTFALSAPINAATGAAGTGTILDNDASPTLSFANVSVSEGASGGTATFTVTLSAVSGRTVTVNYASANGTATAPADYTAVSGTLTFSAGTTSQTIPVPIVNDTADEPNETYTITLSNAVGATIGTATRTGTINDDDSAPTLNFANVSVLEGDSGTVDAVFTVTLSVASGRTITVNYATSNGSASSSSDYNSARGTLTFAAGVTAQTISVQVRGDTTVEPNETLNVTLSGASNATIPTARRTGTILNDD